MCDGKMCQEITINKSTINKSTINKSLFVKTAVLGALLAMLVIPYLFGGEEAAAAPEDGNPKEDYADYGDVDNMVVAYHKTMNKIVNEKIEMFMTYSAEDLEKFDKAPLEIMEETEDENNKIVLTASGKFEPCEPENTSTFCLAELLLREYYHWRQAMLDKRNNIVQTAQVKTSITKEELLNSVGEIDSAIDVELDVARKTMDVTLAAYNELHTAWPVHLEYKVIIEKLEDYRDQIANLRREIEVYPATFLNSSTASCK